MAGSVSDRLQVKLSAWVDRIEAGPVLPPAAVEDLINRSDDPALTRFIRDAVSPTQIKARLYMVKIHLRTGDIDRAFERLHRLEINVNFVRQRIALPLLVDAREQRSRAGKMPKRREWAEVLADELRMHGHSKESRWNAIPDDSFAPLVMEGPDRDFRCYREADYIVCEDDNSGVEVGRLKKSSFLKRYSGQ